jgi:hypothetical protein
MAVVAAGRVAAAASSAADAGGIQQHAFVGFSGAAIWTAQHKKQLFWFGSL